MTSKTIVMTYVHERLHTIVLAAASFYCTCFLQLQYSVCQFDKNVEWQDSKEGENLILSSSLKRRENSNLFDFTFWIAHQFFFLLFSLILEKNNEEEEV